MLILRPRSKQHERAGIVFLNDGSPGVAKEEAHPPLRIPATLDHTTDHEEADEHWPVKDRRRLFELGRRPKDDARLCC